MLKSQSHKTFKKYTQVKKMYYLNLRLHYIISKDKDKDKGNDKGNDKECICKIMALWS